MKNLWTHLNAALVFSLICPICNATEPAVKQCVADLSFSGNTLNVKNITSGAEFNGTCNTTGACEIYIFDSGIFAGDFKFKPGKRAAVKPSLDARSGIFIRPIIDDNHMQFQCMSTACTVSWNRENQSEEKHLKFRQTVIAPLTAQIRFNYL